MPSMTSQRAAKGWTLAHRLQTLIIGRQLVQWFPMTYESAGLNGLFVKLNTSNYTIYTCYIIPILLPLEHSEEKEALYTLQTVQSHHWCAVQCIQTGFKR